MCRWCPWLPLLCLLSSRYFAIESGKVVVTVLQMELYKFALCARQEQVLVDSPSLRCRSLSSNGPGKKEYLCYSKSRHQDKIGYSALHVSALDIRPQVHRLATEFVRGAACLRKQTKLRNSPPFSFTTASSFLDEFREAAT